MDQCDFPASIVEFKRMFDDDAACAAYLEELRWPYCFVCPKCKEPGDPFRFMKRQGVLRCRACRADTSLGAGTTMQGSHTPLSVWFGGAYLAVTQEPGDSAVQFQKQLGISRYETALTMRRMLRSTAEKQKHRAIGGKCAVQVGAMPIDGFTHRDRNGKRKHYVLGAVEVLSSDDEVMRAGSLRLSVVKDIDSLTVREFLHANVVLGAAVQTTLKFVQPALGYRLFVPVEGDKVDAYCLPLIEMILSGFAASWRKTRASKSKQRLQTHVNQYVFDFNRKFRPWEAFNAVLGLRRKDDGMVDDGLFPAPIMSEAERKSIQQSARWTIVEDRDTLVRWMWNGDECIALIHNPKGYRELADR